MNARGRPSRTTAGRELISCFPYGLVNTGVPTLSKLLR